MIEHIFACLDSNWTRRAKREWPNLERFSGRQSKKVFTLTTKPTSPRINLVVRTSEWPSIKILVKAKQMDAEIKLVLTVPNIQVFGRSHPIALLPNI